MSEQTSLPEMPALLNWEEEGERLLALIINLNSISSMRVRKISSIFSFYFALDSTTLVLNF